MSEARKKTESRAAAVQKSPAKKRKQDRRTMIIIASAVLVAILAIVGVAYYSSADAKYRRMTIIEVDDIVIKMPYFLKRTVLAGSDGISMLDTITNEQIIKLSASRYGVEATPQDIDAELRKNAAGESENMTDSEFREWYRQQLNETKLSEADFREIVRVSVLASRLQAIFAEQVPTTGGQVRVSALMFGTYEDAQKAKERLNSGETFVDLAKEFSPEVSENQTPGDMGWVPKGVTPFDHIIFELVSGNVSDPVPYAPDPSSEEVTYYIFMVTDTAADRPIDPDPLAVLKSQALKNWLGEEIKQHSIKYNFNSEINAWIGWQVAKANPSEEQQQQ